MNECMSEQTNDCMEDGQRFDLHPTVQPRPLGNVGGAADQRGTRLLYRCALAGTH